MLEASGLENNPFHQSYVHVPHNVSHFYGTGMHSNVFDQQSTMLSTGSLRQDDQNRGFEPMSLNHSRDVRFISPGIIPNDLVIDGECLICVC
jgi:hypothetical protein